MHQKKQRLLKKMAAGDMDGALGIIFVLEKVMDELRATEPLLFQTWDASEIPDLNVLGMICHNDEVTG